MKLKRFAEINEAKIDVDDRSPITFDYIKECVMELLRNMGYSEEFLQIDKVQGFIESMVSFKIIDIKNELMDLENNSMLFDKLLDDLYKYNKQIGYDD